MEYQTIEDHAIGNHLRMEYQWSECHSIGIRLCVLDNPRSGTQYVAMVTILLRL